MIESDTQRAEEQAPYPPSQSEIPPREQPASTAPVTAVTPTTRRAHVRRSANPGAGAYVGLAGLLVLVIGAWSGIVPFVGPLFGFNGTGTPAWHWDLAHALLWACPGGVALLCGLAMLSRAPSASSGRSRLGSSGPGFLAACCGAWLVVGPVAWRALEGWVPIRHAGPVRELLYYVGYSFGPGVLLVLLGGVALGAAALHRREVQEAEDVLPADGRVAA